MDAGLQPRLMSADGPDIVDALPADPALVPGRASLRGIVDAGELEDVTAVVTAHGGRTEDVREGITQSVRLSTISYNHPTWWLQKKQPGRWFHMECQGNAVVDRLDEVEAVYTLGDGGTGTGLFHLEIGNNMMFGMLNGRIGEHESVEELKARILAGVPELTALGVGVHSPHQWYIDLEPDRVRALADTSDPHGILNPGRWM